MSNEFTDMEFMTFESNLGHDVAHGILMLKNIKEAIKFVEEHGHSFGWDNDLCDDMVSFLIEEQEAVKTDILENYHTATTAGDEWTEETVTTEDTF